MGAILRNDGFGGARSIFPSRLEFTFYEIWTEQEVKAHMARIHKLL